MMMWQVFIAGAGLAWGLDALIDGDLTRALIYGGAGFLNLALSGWCQWVRA